MTKPRWRRVTGLATAAAVPVLSFFGISSASASLTPNTLPTYLSATPYSTSIAVGWSASATAHTGITSYHVQLALAATGTIVGDASTTNLSYRFVGLTPGTRYQWRIAVHQDPWHLNSPWSPWSANEWTTGPTPTGPMPEGVPASEVGAIELNANGAAMLAWQHSATGNQGQDKPGTYGLDANGNLSLSISGAVGTFCQVWGPTFGPYGIYEAKAFLPDNGSGAIADWPAWWLYGQPGPDELDIIEGLGGRSAVHLWWQGGNQGGGWSTIKPGWHVGTVVITPSKVQVYIDGSLFSTFTTGIPVVPMHVIHDIMAGTPPGTGSGPPATYLVQYTRVWNLNLWSTE